MRDPVLAVTSYHDRVPMVFKVKGGLHYIRGNSAPYFSLTYTAHRKGFPEQCFSSGARHDEIEQRFPGRFTQLARMHLSDIDGAPMHAEANAWYRLAGAVDLGEKYHAGNRERHFYKADGTHDGYRFPSAAECEQGFADYVRLSLPEARGIVVAVIAMEAEKGRVGARTWFADWINAQRPRWKAEAEACIAHYGLVVYGDPWKPGG